MHSQNHFKANLNLCICIIQYATIFIEQHFRNTWLWNELHDQSFTSSSIWKLLRCRTEYIISVSWRCIWKYLAAGCLQWLQVSHCLASGKYPPVRPLTRLNFHVFLSPITQVPAYNLQIICGCFFAQPSQFKMHMILQHLLWCDTTSAVYIHSPAISSVITFMLSKAGDNEAGGL